MASSSDESGRLDAIRLLDEAISQATSARTILQRLAWHWEKDAGNEAMRFSEDAAATLSKVVKAIKCADGTSNAAPTRRVNLARANRRSTAPIRCARAILE
jgi:hypothetical protein